jgi:hypothetical protein
VCSGDRIVDATTQTQRREERKQRVACSGLFGDCSHLRSWGSATLCVALGVATALRQKAAPVAVGGYVCAGWQCSD